MTVTSNKPSCPIDFDHASAEHAEHWPSIYKTLRSECPMTWSEHHGGYWTITRYKDLLEAAQDGEVFSSEKTYNPQTGEIYGGTAIPQYPIMPSLPLESAGAEWKNLRSLLNRKLAPKAAEARRPTIERFATALLNRVIETGEIDLVSDLTGPLPAMTTMELIGLPTDEWREFADPLHEMVYWPRESPDFLKKVEDYNWVLSRVREEVQKRRTDPQDDLMTYLVEAEIDGERLTNDTIEQILANIIGGGVDTTTNLTAHVFHYLSENPDARQRLIDEPELLPVAREEFVRYFSPVPGLARTAQSDRELGGVHVQKEDRVLLAFASANRDEAIFERPDELVLDRFPNRHIGFGAGMHRCIGSFLARIMFQVMVTQVLTRIPDYKVLTDKARRYPSFAAINGWIDLPSVFTPGEKLPCDLVL